MKKGKKLYEGKAKIIYETSDKNIVIQYHMIVLNLWAIILCKNRKKIVFSAKKYKIINKERKNFSKIWCLKHFIGNILQAKIIITQKILMIF